MDLKREFPSTPYKEMEKSEFETVASLESRAGSAYAYSIVRSELLKNTKLVMKEVKAEKQRGLKCGELLQSSKEQARLSKLLPQNVARVFAYSARGCYAVVEYAEGQTLKQTLERLEKEQGAESREYYWNEYAKPYVAELVRVVQSIAGVTAYLEPTDIVVKANGVFCMVSFSVKK